MIVTLVPALRDVLIVVALAFAPFPDGVNVFGLKPLNEPFEVDVAISTLAGSNSHSPPCPLKAEAVTNPKAWRLFLLEVSTKPPFPDTTPPLAEMSPKNPVYSFDQRITLPPSPATVASAAIELSELITMASAFRTSGFNPW